MSNHMAADTSKPGAFDGQRPPAPELISQCVHCGFCLPACPTYALWGEEMDSPRGRIYLMKAASEDGARMTETFVRHFDTCLGCMACMTACPSGVQYDKLIEATRAQVERNHQRPLSQRWLRRMIFSTFPRPDRLRRMATPLLWYQRSGVQQLLRATGLLRLLPASLRSMEALLPTLDKNALQTSIPPITAAAGEKRKRVGVLLGCVQQVFFANVNAATIRVLAAEGC